MEAERVFGISAYGNAFFCLPFCLFLKKKGITRFSNV